MLLVAHILLDSASALSSTVLELHCCASLHDLAFSNLDLLGPTLLSLAFLALTRPPTVSRTSPAASG